MIATPSLAATFAAVLLCTVAAPSPARARISLREPVREPAQEGATDTASAQDIDEEESTSPIDDLDWSFGPGRGELGSWAHVEIPDGWRFVGPRDTRKLMEMMQNPVSNSEAGFLSPPDIEWFCVFEFEETGYVPDDEKTDLDAAAMLESMKEGTERANEERRKRGWTTLEIIGWEQEPRYDANTNNLEWSTRARDSEGDVSVNHNTRLLGRRGVMSATLVVSPEGLAEALPIFKEALRGYSYNQGERYAEYKSGDKIAEYGLTALIAGGAGAVAAKTGLLGKFWKVIAAALVAIGAFFKKIFGGGKKETSRTRQ